MVITALKAAPYIDTGLFGILHGLAHGLNSPFHVNLTEDSFRTVLIFSLIYIFGIMIYISSKKNYRNGEEHGSAKWGKLSDMKKYQSKTYSENKLLTKNVRMDIIKRKHMRNANTLVIGGSGSGKTRFFAKPNLMQANTSFVVLDPKAELFRSCGGLLRDEGYEIKVLDLLNMENSHCYNPFSYIKNDNDVMRLVTNLVKNTTPRGVRSSDPFWEKSEIALLEALIFYLLYEAPEYEQNFGMVMELLDSAGAKEDDEEYYSILDVIFSRLSLREPDHIAVRQYNVFKKAAGKTAKSILVSLAVRLEKFNLDSLRDITNTDEMNLAQMGERKTALFCIIPDNDSSFNFVVGMLYTQLFQVLYSKADSRPDGKLPVHVHFLMDEFANIALPDEFDKILSTMRSREISVSIIIQNLAQLKALFEKEWESLTGNCDQLLYLGGNEKSTHQYISELLGKETIDTRSFGQSKGRGGQYSVNMQKSGRELLSPDEVRLLDNEYAILFIRGERPMIDKKYDILSHPNIKRTSDGGRDNFRMNTKAYEIPFTEITLTDNGDYEILTNEELEELLTKGNTNEQNT